MVTLQSNSNNKQTFTERSFFYINIKISKPTHKITRYNVTIVSNSDTQVATVASFHGAYNFLVINKLKSA